MDLVKKIMAQLYKHGFWICCGVIAIASVAIGVMQTLSVQENAVKQQSRIKAAMDGITPVGSFPKHPNSKTAAARDAINLELENRVYQLWNRNFQKQRIVLTWPLELETGFHNEIKDLKYLQPELLPIDSEKGLLSKRSRDIYRNYIVDELPKLATIIKAKWHLDLTGGASAGGGVGGPGGGGRGGPGGPPGGIGGVGPGGPPGGMRGGPGGRPGGMGGESGEGMGGGGASGSVQVYDPSEVVAWDAGSQQMLVTKVFHGISLSSDSPSTLTILYAQEDLWIVKALLNVIAKTNGDALERHRAPIKEIRELSTGREAGTKVGGINMFFQTASAAPTTGPAVGPTPSTSGAPVVGAPGAPGAPGGNPYGGGAAAVGGHPGDLRYVDANFAPKTVTEIKTAIESEAFTDAPLAVAKRVPFRMRLIMDQRELSKFLVNCGNNELMVEVSQVRYNPQANSTGSGSSGSGMMPGGPPGGVGKGAGGPSGGPGGPPGGGPGGPPGGDDDGGGGGMRGGIGGGSGTTVAIAEPVGISPYDILVDIFGYVQIYNIPATKKFKNLDQLVSTADKPASEVPVDSTVAPPAVVPAATDANSVPAAKNDEAATPAEAPANGAAATASPAPSALGAEPPPPNP